MAENQEKNTPTPEETEETQAAEAVVEETTGGDGEAAEATDVETADVETSEAVEAAGAEEAEAGETGPVSRMIEEAVDAAVEDMNVPTAEDAGIDLSAPDEFQTAFDDAAAMQEASEGVGYTGEIVGRVVKLEDLEAAEREQDKDRGHEQYLKLVEQTFTAVSEQEIVKGRVVSVGEKEIVVDFGFKSDGVVAKNEFDRELGPGDEVEVYLERFEDYHGQPVISKTKADQVRRWQRIEDAYENEEVIEGTIVRRIKGGMITELDIGNMEAFLPGSQIDVRPVRDFDAYLEKRMEFKIVKLNPANENIVVSHKALIEKDLQAQREKILSTMEAGQILEGTVKNITDFGVFIDLGGVDGLLHITDLSWGRVSHPSELVNLDEQMNVVVLDYDKERQRISLGLKQLQPHPWENIEEKFAKGQVVEGKVVSITDYGAFVELEKGIEGLVHISEMSWTEHIKHPSQKVSLGQLVDVKILNIDTEGKKISLGMKQLEPDPWEGLSLRYPPGTVMRGKVRNITNFGVFVEIEPGIDGLVHISDLSWTKKVKHPSEMIKKGQDLDVVVLNIDEKERRISLGHKQVETNPWNQFAKVYGEGAATDGSIASIEDKGIVVDLPMDVQGFIPASELKNGPRDFQNFYALGDKLEGLEVIRFDPGQKEIVLSEVAQERARARAERRDEQRERREERDRERREISEFQRGGTSGPTTLGELSGLADLRRQMEAAEAEGAADVAQAAADAEPETESAEPDAAAKENISEAKHDDATVVEEGATPEEQADAAADESDETVVATAEASGELEGTPGTKNRAAGKTKQSGGDAGSTTEPSDESAQRQEDAGTVTPSEKSKAAVKGAGDTEKEGAAEAAEAATEDETPTADTGEKPVASVEAETNVPEVESFKKASGEDAITTDDVKKQAGDDEDEGK